MDEFRDGISEGAAQKADEAVESVEEGYSSLEIAAESGAEEVDAAEPDLEAAAEAAEEEKAEEAEEEKKE